MSKAAIHDHRILLVRDIAENAALASHYSAMTPTYADLNDRAGMRYSLKSAIAYIKAAARSWNDLEMLDDQTSESSK